MLNKMKELPADARPYEKAERYGFAALSNAELLAIIIRNGNTRHNVLEISQNLLQAEGNSFQFLQRRSLKELCRYDGIGRIKALQLLAVGELSKRTWQSAQDTHIAFDAPERIFSYYREELRYLPNEVGYLLILDAKCRLKERILLSTGTVNSAVISPRDVFVKALQHQAVSVIIMHNHPSGDPTPSEEDIRFTKNLAQIGEMMQLPVLDHIIVGDTTYVSMKQEGLL